MPTFFSLHRLQGGHEERPRCCSFKEEKSCPGRRPHPAAVGEVQPHLHTGTIKLLEPFWSHDLLLSAAWGRCASWTWAAMRWPRLRESWPPTTHTTDPSLSRWRRPFIYSHIRSFERFVIERHSESPEVPRRKKWGKNLAGVATRDRDSFLGPLHSRVATVAQGSSWESTRLL